MKIADLIVSLIPASFRDRAKAVVALVISVGAIVSTLAGAPAWVTVGLLILNAPVVYGIGNEGEADAEGYTALHGAP